METRAFGKTGMNVSVLGFGGAEIGFQSTPQADVNSILNNALDLGLNVIDTAECYDASEEKIGNAVSNRRQDYYLFTKCGHSSGFPLPDWDPKMLAQSIDRSLQRLQTDYVDLVQLHSCSEDLLRQGDVIDVLLRAKEAGKTRFIGYSGDDKDALFAVNSGVFDSLQTSISIADQDCIELTLPTALSTGMGVIAKRPVANAAWASGLVEPVNNYVKPYWLRLKELDYEFLAEPLDAAVGIALRFTLSQPAVSVAIVGTQNASRWATNSASAMKGPLSSEFLSQIRHRWNDVARQDWVGLN